MPLYVYACSNGHQFERIAPVSAFCRALPCPECAASAAIVPQLFAAATSDRGTAMVDAVMYEKHNVTTVTKRARPVSPADQCQCGNCASHRRRNPITRTADVNKSVAVL